MIARFPAKLRRFGSLGRDQASWSIRVPCPGGSGACAGGVELESPASLSLSLSLLGGGGELGCWLLLATGGAGAVVETLEILMGRESFA
jgi:hypothetical protein